MRGTWGTHSLWVLEFRFFRREILDQCWQVFPEEFAAVDDLAGAHVEEIDGEGAVFEVIAEDVGVVAELGGCDALLFLKLVDGGELVAETCGGFEVLGFGGGGHARDERALEFGMAAFEEELGVADGALVELWGGQTLDAWAEAAVNVELEAGAQMVAREIDLATGDEKAAVDEFDDAIGKVAGKVGAVVSGAVFAQAAGDEDFGEAVGEGELDVGVGFVVAEEDVEAGMALLDEVVFKSEGLLLIGDEDVVEVDGLAHEGAGFCVNLRSFKEVGADARTEALGLADVDDFAFGVFVEIDARLGRQISDFLVKVHGGEGHT